MIAHRITRGVEKDVASETLEPDQLILVKPGETIPADGMIVEGATTVNEHSVTGEHRIIEKFPASKVYATSVNLSSRIVVRVSGIDTFQSRIEALKKSALNSKSSEESRGRSASLVAILAILVAAAITGFVRYQTSMLAAIISCLAVLLAGAPWLFNQRKGAYKQALSQLAEEGVLVKDCDTLSSLNDVKTIYFDKTGVLTTGDIRVEHVVSFKPYTQQQVLNLAATLEHKSSHPLAHTIVSFSKSFGASFQRVESWKEETGLGVSGKLNSKVVLVGSSQFMEEHNVTLPETSEHKEEGRTIVYVVSGNEVMGYIALADSLRQDAKQVIHELKQHHRVVLVSGDNEDTAAAVGMQLGVHEVSAKMGSAKRAAHVTLSEKSGANVTITFGKQFADVTILRPEIILVGKLFVAAKKCRQRIRKRLVLGGLYHIVMLPLAAVSYLFIGIWVAPAAIAVMLIATATSLQLSRNGPAGI